MKNVFILIIFLSISCVISRAQSVFPTYNDAPSWRVSETGWHGSAGLTYTIWVKKDTNLCGKTYNPIIAVDYPKLRDTTILGYYRQENKRVFFRLYNKTCEIEPEYIIYDFSLKVKDSLNIGNGVIAVIGDERYENYEGISRRTLGISYTDGNGLYYGFGSWIEGIGELHNPFTTPFCVGAGCYDTSITICMKKKEGIQLSLSEEACRYNNLTTGVKNVNTISGQFYIHSNPLGIKNPLQINYTLLDSFKGKLSIVNVFGQRLFTSTQNISAAEGTLDLPWSPTVPGIYLLVFESDRGERQSLRLVVQ